MRSDDDRRCRAKFATVRRAVSKTNGENKNARATSRRTDAWRESMHHERRDVAIPQARAAELLPIERNAYDREPSACWRRIARKLVGWRQVSRGHDDVVKRARILRAVDEARSGDHEAGGTRRRPMLRCKDRERRRRVVRERNVVAGKLLAVLRELDTHAVRLHARAEADF